MLARVVRFSKGDQCAVRAYAGGAGRAAEDLCDLREGQVVVAAEHEHFALIRRQVRSAAECLELIGRSDASDPGASTFQRSAIR